MYRAMLRELGPQYWWPARTRFEVIVGAILTQNTAWSNVERAIFNLRKARVLHPDRLRRVPKARLARLLRPSGYFNVKAGRLRSFLGWFHLRFGGSLDRMFATPLGRLREELLGVNGIGRETADSILCYAGDLPVFVVDAYTRRILSRHGLSDPGADYEEVRVLFERSLPQKVSVYNECHALLVNVGKNFCRPRNPRCEQCPLEPFLPGGRRPAF
jgi:endonuclease-3 related protein